MALLTRKHHQNVSHNVGGINTSNPDTKADKQCNLSATKLPKERRPKKIRCMFCDYWTYDDRKEAMTKHTNFYHGWKL
ncbi:hypothetical protein GGI12_000895 [Dipsacomyces acuminosporus]|nr:hypothetical protein GGI12_000895 [Dipsacomyces acuminosporus]